jgi:hypothetical protein
MNRHDAFRFYKVMQTARRREAAYITTLNRVSSTSAFDDPSPNEECYYP